MEENFKEIIEDIKKEEFEHSDIKKYILAVKRVLRKAIDNCEDESEKEETLEAFLQEYDKDLEFRGNAEELFYKVIRYNTYKRALVEYKGNKAKFDKLMREARKREAENSTERLTSKLDMNESMVSAIRYLIRRTGGTFNEKWIIERIQEGKTGSSKDLKKEMIRIIQTCVATLEEYGFIDEYIQTANSDLNKLGLEGLEYYKRNPIADEQYDENGKLVKDVEDIGVIDTFNTENLENLLLGDLQVMTAFWESKYLQERLGISKAMSTINTLNLWDVLMKGEDKDIENLDDRKLDGALKKDLALTYLCKNDVRATSKMKKQYSKFLKENNLCPDVDLETELRYTLPEISNLEAAAKDVGIFECLIIHQLKEKDIKIKKWGVVKGQEKSEDTNIENGMVIAIENPNFRGPLIMEVSPSVLKRFFSIDDIELPEYTKELDETYCNIMSKLYLPANKFFSEFVKKSYKENPQSKFLANLAGKKVKKEVKDER